MIKMKWRKYSKSLRINTFMVMDNEKNTYLLLWQMRYVTIPFGAGTQRVGWNPGGGGITSFTPLNTPLCTLIHPFYPFFIFPTPHFFPQQSFTSFPTTIEFFPGKFYGCGEAGKGLLGKKMRGWGKWKNEKMVFLLLIFSPNPQFLYFSPAAIFPLNGSWNVTLIYNYQQKCAIY